MMLFRKAVAIGASSWAHGKCSTRWWWVAVKSVRPVHLDRRSGWSFVTTFVADALIASTATGSTAYALAAGGPILPPELRNILLVPVAPHLSLDRVDCAGRRFIGRHHCPGGSPGDVVRGWTGANWPGRWRPGGCCRPVSIPSSLFVSRIQVIFTAT